MFEGHLGVISNFKLSKCPIITDISVLLKFTSTYVENTLLDC